MDPHHKSAAAVPDTDMAVLDKSVETAVKKLAKQTPCYCYFEQKLIDSATLLKSYKAPFGLTVRYAMKANSNKAILKLLEGLGLWVDASSVNECYRALAAGIPAHKISLTTQEVPTKEQLQDLVIKTGIKCHCSSLLQLRNFGLACPGHEVGVRFNIGIGSGSYKRTTTGGTHVSFGIYEQRTEIDRLLKEFDLKLTTVHLHIGSGADPELQKQAACKALEVVGDYPTVTTLDLGGGFKVKRGKADKQTSIPELSQSTYDALVEFEKKTHRKIHLEIEPGTYAVALAGYVVAEVIDVVSTGSEGHEFIKLNAGMTEAMRISLYGAQHPMYVVPMDDSPRKPKDYIVVGSCCETGDVLTPAPGMPEETVTRRLLEAKPGDLFLIGASGAYCASMSPSNYNSHTIPMEFLARADGTVQTIRKVQPLEDLWKYEIAL